MLLEVLYGLEPLYGKGKVDLHLLMEVLCGLESRYGKGKEV